MTVKMQELFEIVPEVYYLCTHNDRDFFNVHRRIMYEGQAVV